MNREDRHDLGSYDGNPDDDAASQVASQLRAALDTDARSIRPADRLDAIIAATRDDAPLAPTKGAPSARRWLVPAAAAAAAAIVAATAWAANRPAERAQVPVGASTSAAATTGGRPAQTSSDPPPTSSPNASATSPNGSDYPTAGPLPMPAALPVYRVGVLDAAGSRLGLVREFVPPSALSRTTPSPTTPSQRALAAATLSIEDSAATFDAGYRALWAGARVVNVDVRPDLILVTLTHGATGLNAAEARLAVQQLVWTVQSAAGASNLPPVRFALADGSTALAGSLTTASSYNRPTDPMQVATILAPLWIDQPYRKQALVAGAPLTVTGQASTFEANVAWTLERAGTPVASGSTTATVAAPARGTFSFRTGPLARGDYSITVLERSPNDGNVTSQWQIPFSVR